MASEFLDIMFTPGPEEVHAINVNIATLRSKQDAGERLPDHAFQLATALISHTDRKLVAEGVQLLEGLSFQYWQTAKHEATAPSDAKGNRESGQSRLVDSCFYLAIGHTKLGDTVKARSSIEKMLVLAPNHRQGVALRERLDNDMYKDGVKGLLGLTTALLGVGVIYGLLRGRK